MPNGIIGLSSVEIGLSWFEIWFELANQTVTFKNESDRIIYEYAKTNGFITSAQVQQITAIKTRQGASVALNRLIMQNFLRINKKGKLTIYEFVN